MVAGKDAPTLPSIRQVAPPLPIRCKFSTVPGVLLS